MSGSESKEIYIIDETSIDYIIYVIKTKEVKVIDKMDYVYNKETRILEKRDVRIPFESYVVGNVSTIYF